MKRKRVTFERCVNTVAMIVLDAVFCFFAFVFATWFMNSAINGAYGFPFTVRGEAYYTIPQVMVFTALYIVSFAVFRLYSSLWKVGGISEGMMMIAGVGVGALATLLANWGLSFFEFFYSIGFTNNHKAGMCVAAVFICAMLIISRFGFRVVRKLIRDAKLECDKSGKKRTLIIGAGYFGAYLLSQIRAGQSAQECIPIAFIDDNPMKLHKRIDGVKVVGTSAEIPEVVQKLRISEIIIAIPSITPEKQAELVTICRSTKCHIRLVPTLRELNSVPTMHDIRETNITDILFRQEVQLDRRSIAEYIEHKVVLVTGGGGSIGAEICRQVATFYPSKLIIFDIYENSAYELQCELRRKYNWLDVKVCIGSVRDRARLDMVMNEFKPDIVIHAAAHKHVPLMEACPAEAVKNNVFGTINVLRSAEAHGVKRFVQISTDKAVNPANVMGATKRITEIAVQLAAKKSVMRCMTVRFGNVLGSRGSVIPLFESQIKAGGPVLVTDKEITRYFMTIPEAAQLVLQAGALGESGAIYVLDMGEPVRIYELAEKVMRFHGIEPNVDMPIEIVGLRPGEKMYEELLTPDENNAMEKTAHGRIFKAHPEEFDEERFELQLDELRRLAEINSNSVVECMKEMIPTFNHQNCTERRTA